ncbi:MAG: Coenzyme F420 hydrogenase/dehydrogenase, beta subunit C-terminal domain [Sulfolobales archaeon]|nr:Coenzyme F420 hydrogenase/dehydrogenase, beta subunit C-terminal domain [Sulfolobales archaeon]
MEKAVVRLLNVSENIERGFCSFCGACIAVCPFNNLSYELSNPSKPTLGDSKFCKKCKQTLCVSVCPQLNVPRELFSINTYVFSEAYEARSTIPEVIKVAQDGGAVTSLLIAGLKLGLFDAALVTSRDEVWRPKPSIAVMDCEVIEAAGTKYVYSPTLLALKDLASRRGVKSVAIVGLPCQIMAVEKMKRLSLKLFEGLSLVSIGLFCTHNFTYEKILSLTNDLKIKIGDLTKISIKKGKLIFTTKDGGSALYSLSKASKDMRTACMQCPEFISPYADLNIGSIGSSEGWSTVLVMNGVGRRILAKAVDWGFIEAKPLSIEGRDAVFKFIEKKVRESLEKYGEYTRNYGDIINADPSKW